MTNQRADELVIKLEESLGISTLESGPKLIGVIIADKIPNRGAIKNILTKAWETYGEVKITYMKDNLFTITVQDESMADNVINDGPWSVMGCCFSVQRWPDNLAIEEMPLHLVSYWIQAHGIPMNLMTTGNATEIGKKLGTVVEVEDPWQMGSRGFLRFRVQIDSRLPLHLGFWLPRRESPDTWVEFKIERLSDFCFFCGRLGHNQNGCKAPHDQSTLKGSTSYGDWLRTRAIRDQRPPQNLNIPRGVRRRAGETETVIRESQVARVIQQNVVETASSIVDDNPRHAHQDAIGKSGELAAGSQNSLMHAEHILPCDGQGSNSNTDKGKKPNHNQVQSSELQLYDWGVADRGDISSSLAHRGVTLVDEFSPPFEERLKWACSQLSLGQQYATNWTHPGPSHLGQKCYDLRPYDTHINIEPIFRNPFGPISGVQRQPIVQQIDGAFEHWGFKREANSVWTGSPKGDKRSKFADEVEVGNVRPHRSFKSHKSSRKQKVGSSNTRVLNLSEEELTEVQIGLEIDIPRGHTTLTQGHEASNNGGGGWPNTATGVP